MTFRTLQIVSIILGGITTFAATDIFLPSLPTMAIYFGTSADITQLAIPVYLVGSLLGAPLLGFLSDHYGRRPLMFSGLGLFMVGTLLCLYSSNFVVFLIGRFIQGFGATANSVVGWAIIQDLYPSDKSAKIMAWMGSIVALAPLLAPAVGGYIHDLFGWQGNFYIIFILSLITFTTMIFVKKVKTVRSTKNKLSFFSSLGIYTRILKDKPFLYYISFFALLNSGFWCYLTVIPFYFENTLHLMPNVFGLFIAAAASFRILGALSTPLLLNLLNVNKIIGLGVIIALLSSSLFVLISFVAPTSHLLIVLTIGVYLFGTAILWGPTNSRALQRFEDIRGAASGARHLVIMGSFAVGGFVGSILEDTTIFPLSLFLLSMALLSCIIFQNLLKFENRQK